MLSRTRLRRAMRAIATPTILLCALAGMPASTLASAGAEEAPAEEAPAEAAPAQEAAATDASTDEPTAETRDPNAPPPVARALFTTGVSEREPVDSVDELAGGTDVIFYTELQQLSGQQIIHRWEWNEQVMAEVPFQVGGPRWRIWSSKKLDPSWIGEWTASVVDAEGTVLAREAFTFTAASDDAGSEAPASDAKAEVAAENEESAATAPPAAAPERAD